MKDKIGRGANSSSSWRSSVDMWQDLACELPPTHSTFLASHHRRRLESSVVLLNTMSSSHQFRVRRIHPGRLHIGHTPKWLLQDDASESTSQDLTPDPSAPSSCFQSNPVSLVANGRKLVQLTHGLEIVRRKTMAGEKRAARRTVAQIMQARQSEILEDWLTFIGKSAGTRTLGLMSREELREEADGLLGALAIAFRAEQYTSIQQPEFEDSVAMLERISASRAKQGFTPTETTVLVLSLKDALLKFLQQEFGNDAEMLNTEIVKINRVIDLLALVTFETYMKTREEIVAGQKEEIIALQQRSLEELSTPVIKIWNELVLLPLIGVVDTIRAQSILENLLQSIVKNEARVAILDVTGVPVIDTSVAKHLLDAIVAAKMLGAEVILTGIGPKAAQTMSKLAIDLSQVRTSGSLRAGITEALAFLGVKLVATEEHQA